MLYLDNAATSWPKPPAVKQAVLEALEGGGNPGRSGHGLALGAARRVLAAREALAELLGVPDPAQITLTGNATQALNLAIRGLVRPGDRVVTTAVEHNSVMRPLRELERQGATLVVLPSGSDGLVDPADLRQALQSPTRLVAVSHGSNVLGTIQPIAELGRLSREAEALFLVDGAQTAGALPLNLARLPVDLFAFTGHKALLGPQGTGGLYLREGLDLEPLFRGGTGSASELEEQPDFAPDRYESGTPNVPGLAGLAAGVEYLLGLGVEAVRAHEVALTRRFLEGLREISSLTLYGPADAASRTALVSLNMEGVTSAMLAQALEEGFAVLTRAGLHCAPAAHKTAGTYPGGSVRFSFSAHSTEADVDGALDALRCLATHR